MARKTLGMVFACLVLVFAAFLFWVYWKSWNPTPIAAVKGFDPNAKKLDKPFPPPVAPSALSSTRMIPFDTATIKEGENMIYCPTFALAWKRFLNDAASQSAPTNFAEKIAAVTFTSDDINAKDLRLVAGPRDTVEVAKVRKELELEGAPVIDDSAFYENIVYCSLKKQLPFATEFEPFNEPLKFKSKDKIIEVRSFGVTSRWDHWARAVEQIQVLDYRSPDDFTIRIANLPGEDMILAKMSQPKSLADGIAQINEKIRTAKVALNARTVVSGEQFVFPVLELSLLEDFSNDLFNPSHREGRRVIRALQLIQFRLDEKGAKLISEAALHLDNGHYEAVVGERTFIFDKPFMVVLRESTNRQPYFAAWIANADFMTPEEQK
jgi:hypothetical protein